MDERSFQRLSLVFNSHHIPFQAPAVVSEKVYILPSLVEVFHNSNVYSSLENSQSVTVESAVWYSCLELAETLQSLFNFLLSTSSNIGSFMSSIIYQPWFSSCLSMGTSTGGKQTRCFPCPLSSQSSSRVWKQYFVWFNERVKLNIMWASF